MCRAYAFICCRFFFLNYTATTEIYTYGHTLSLHDALPISARAARTPSGANSGPKSFVRSPSRRGPAAPTRTAIRGCARSEEHTSELQSLMRISYAVFCLKKKKYTNKQINISHREN